MKALYNSDEGYIWHRKKPTTSPRMLLQCLRLFTAFFLNGHICASL